MIFRPIALTAMLSLVFAGSAMASATADCSASDANIEFSLMGSVGSSSEGISPQGIELRLKGVPQLDFEFQAEDEDHKLMLGQQWIREPELRLRIYTKKGLEFTLQMKRPEPDEASEYVGVYEIIMKSNGVERKHTGEVRCMIAH